MRRRALVFRFTGGGETYVGFWFEGKNRGFFWVSLVFFFRSLGALLTSSEGNDSVALEVWFRLVKRNDWNFGVVVLFAFKKCLGMMF